MANILIKQGLEIAVPDFVITTDEARKVDLTSIVQTGTTASQAISAGTYFYLNGTLVRAKVDIANGATFTLNTNYEVVTAGALNELAVRGDGELLCASTSSSWESKTVSSLSGYKTIMVGITDQSGGTYFRVFYGISIPRNLMVSTFNKAENNIYGIYASANLSVNVYYIDDTHLMCRYVGGSGYQCSVFGIK